MTQLPTGWTRARLGDVCTSVEKRDPSTIGREHIKYVDIGSVDGGTQKLAPIEEIQAATAPTRARQVLVAGDTVFSTVRPYLKKIAFIDEDLDGEFASTGFCVLRPSAQLHPKWLFYFATSNQLLDQVLPLQRGVSYPAVRDKDVLGSMIPVPPLEEQRRIVDILEDHLSRLDAAEHLLRVSHRRANLLQDISIYSLLTGAGGSPTKLGDLVTHLRNGIFVSRAKPAGLGVPILRIGAVRPLRLDHCDVRSSERDEEELRREDSLLLPGDLVFTRYNGNPAFVGACAVVGEGLGALTYPDKLIRVAVDRSRVLPDFLALACSVGPGRAQIQERVKTTSGQAGISGRDLRTVQVSLPSLEVQSSVVQAASRAIEAKWGLTRTLDVLLRRSDALRRSLLAAAFDGRLSDRRDALDHLEEVRA